MTDIQILQITWKEFDRAVESLVDQLPVQTMQKEGFKIYGQPRGGLPLAVALSHRTGLKLCISMESPGVLWVDDIIDSGFTYSDALSACSKAGIRFIGAVMLSKLVVPATVCVGLPPPPDIHAWLVFPWENLEKAHHDIQVYKKVRMLA